MVGFCSIAVAKNHHIPSILNKFLAHMAFSKKMLSILGNCYPNSPSAPIPSDLSDIFIYFRNTHENKKVVNKAVSIFASLFKYFLFTSG